ncbi:MAG: YybH family protein [Longimicrobiaceae bacterium]
MKILPLIALSWLLAGAGCAPRAAFSPAPVPANATTRAEIVSVLESSAGAWNRGDLDGFLEPYLDSERITFAGGEELLRGKREVRERYRSSYFGAGAPESTLRFEEVEVTRLGPDHALAVGRWLLADRESGEESARGWFSLLLVRSAAGWKIIHDHSS